MKIDEIQYVYDGVYDFDSLSKGHIAILNKAIEEASKSHCKKRHCAILVNHGKIVSIAVNKNRNDPYFIKDNVKKLSIHAEENAIKSSSIDDTFRCQVFVARINKQGRPALSRPCLRCQKFMKKHNIKCCYYSVDSDTFGYMKIL